MQVLLKGTLLVTGHAKKVPPTATSPESAASLLGSPLDSLLTASSAASAATVVASRGPSGVFRIRRFLEYTEYAGRYVACRLWTVVLSLFRCGPELAAAETQCLHKLAGADQWGGTRCSVAPRDALRTLVDPPAWQTCGRASQCCLGVRCCGGGCRDAACAVLQRHIKRAGEPRMPRMCSAPRSARFGYAPLTLFNTGAASYKRVAVCTAAQVRSRALY